MAGALASLPATAIQGPLQAPAPARRSSPPTPPHSHPSHAESLPVPPGRGAPTYECHLGVWRHADVPLRRLLRQGGTVGHAHQRAHHVRAVAVGVLGVAIGAVVPAGEEGAMGGRGAGSRLSFSGCAYSLDSRIGTRDTDHRRRSRWRWGGRDGSQRDCGTSPVVWPAGRLGGAPRAAASHTRRSTAAHAAATRCCHSICPAAAPPAARPQSKPPPPPDTHTHLILRC